MIDIVAVRYISIKQKREYQFYYNTSKDTEFIITQMFLDFIYYRTNISRFYQKKENVMELTDNL